MKKFAVILVLASILFAACADNWEGTGQVVDKQYQPASSWYSPGFYMPGSCYQSGKSEICNSGYFVPGHWNDEPEHWKIKVEDSDSESGKKHWKYVDQQTYGTCKVGSTYDHGSCHG